MSGLGDALTLFNKMYDDMDAIAKSRGLYLATVAAIPAAGVVKIQTFDAATPQDYQMARLLTFAPNVGDTVLVAPVPGGAAVVVAPVMKGATTYTLDNVLDLKPNITGAALTIENQGGNSGVELGKKGTPETPYVDFHSGPDFTDYDARIIASGGDAFNGDGALSFLAKTVSFPNGVLNNLMMNAGYTLLDGTIADPAQTASTTSLSVFAAAVSKAITLPAGTWSLLLVGGGLFSNSTGEGAGVTVHLSNSTTVATNSEHTKSVDSNASLQIVTQGTLANLSGSQTIYLAYHASASGTASCALPWFLVFGRQTA